MRRAEDELVSSEICTATYTDGVDKVRALLSVHGRAAINIRASTGNTAGYTPLTAASGFCTSLELIDVLLQHGADIDQINHYGRTPLMCAVINGSPEVTAHLLRRGAKHDIQHKNGMHAADYARKAIAESRTESERTEALAVDYALRVGRARQRLGMLARHVRIELIACCWKAQLLLLFDEVHYRPSGLGARACREHFEACVEVC